MKTDYKDIDFNLALIPLVAELASQQDISDSLRTLRLNAIGQLTAHLNYYKKLGYIDRLLYAIAEKKGKMILETTSKTEMEKLLKARAPHYNGNTFFAGKYGVPEEELICWSETSLRAPLNDAGAKRYYQVFSEIFPEEYARIQNLSGVRYGN